MKPGDIVVMTPVGLLRNPRLDPEMPPEARPRAVVKWVGTKTIRVFQQGDHPDGVVYLRDSWEPYVAKAEEARP